MFSSLSFLLHNKMGCGAGKPQPDPEQQKKIDNLEAEKSKQGTKIASLENEIKKIKSAAEVPIPVSDAKMTNDNVASGPVTVKVIVASETLSALMSEGLQVQLVNATPLNGITELPCLITGDAAAVNAAVAKHCTARTTSTTLTKKFACDDEPPPAFGEQSKDPDAEPDKESEVKKELPKQTIKCSSAVDVGKWAGKIKVLFEWVTTPTPFSEFLDPSGANWKPKTGTIWAAPDKKPSSVQLEWRHGPTDSWKVIPCTDCKCDLLIENSEVKSSNFNGFQSRWRVDGELFLSPLQRAPTLISKLMKYPLVRSAYRALPEDKRDLDNLPENVQKPLKALENIIPMNTWDIGFGVTTVPGGFIEGVHAMTLTEKAENMAKQKLNDPSMQATIRGEALKAPIQAVSAGLGVVGIKLAMIVGNMDFFIPKPTDPNLEAYRKIQEDEINFEQLRNDMQTDINVLYPDYQQGIRVTVPGADELALCIRSKRPTAEEGTVIPVVFKHTFSDKDQFKSKQEVSVTFWTSSTNRQTASLTAIELEEKAGMLSSDMVTVYKEYIAEVELSQGTYKYFWTINGDNFYGGGRPLPDGENNYCEVDVRIGVKFGIGYPIP